MVTLYVHSRLLLVVTSGLRCQACGRRWIVKRQQSSALLILPVPLTGILPRPSITLSSIMKVAISSMIPGGAIRMDPALSFHMQMLAAIRVLLAMGVTVVSMFRRVRLPGCITIRRGGRRLLCIDFFNLSRGGSPCLTSPSERFSLEPKKQGEARNCALIRSILQREERVNNREKTVIKHYEM